MRLQLTGATPPAVAVAIALIVAGATVAAASEKSQLLVSRGLIRLHAGNSAAALQAFDAAVAADRADVEARYYRAVALARTERLDDAASDLERVLEARPDFHRARLELGSILLRLGRTENALVHLKRAERDPALAPAASRLAAEAREESGEPVAHRRLLLHGRLGFDYDSNVALAPDDDGLADAVGIGDQSDGRAVLEAGAAYDLIQTGNLVVRAGYELFQSLHFDLDRFDLQDHRGIVEVAARKGPVTFGIASRYDYYLRDAESFLEEASAAPWARLDGGRIGDTELYYRILVRDFIERPFDEVRDARNHAVGIRQIRRFGMRERYVAMGYRYDNEDPQNAIGEQFAYDGHELNAELGWTLPAAVGLELAYAYRNESYDDSASQGREDDAHRFLARLRRPLADYVWLTAAYTGTINDSTRDLFEYERHVGSVALELEY